eukprot:Amastigsp_a341290_34.p4 type:complete len:149 gc:universal Amastigsp_a341290_34:748-1194(+)
MTVRVHLLDCKLRPAPRLDPKRPRERRVRATTKVSKRHPPSQFARKRLEHTPQRVEHHGVLLVHKHSGEGKAHRFEVHVVRVVDAAEGRVGEHLEERTQVGNAQRRRRHSQRLVRVAVVVLVQNHRRKRGRGNTGRSKSLSCSVRAGQ